MLSARITKEPHQRSGRSGVPSGPASAAAGAAFCTVLVIAAALNLPAFSRTGDDDDAIAKSLAAMLRAGRTVISKNQDRINDPNVGSKGIDGKMVLAEASAIYQQSAGVNSRQHRPELAARAAHSYADGFHRRGHGRSSGHHQSPGRRI